MVPRPRAKAVNCAWCHQPALEFGPDSATDPKLSPPPQRGARRADWLLAAVLRGRARREIAVDTLYPRCAGIDVHKNNVVVCVRCCDRSGKISEEVRTFSTMTADLLVRSDWLAEHGVTHVAMESKGFTGSRSSTSWRAVSR